MRAPLMMLMIAACSSNASRPSPPASPSAPAPASPPAPAPTADAALVALPTAPDPFPGWTRIGLGRAAQVRLTSDGKFAWILRGSWELALLDLATNTERFATKLTSTSLTLRHHYSDTRAVIVGTQRVHIVDAATGAVIDVACPDGNVVGAGVTDSFLGLACTGSVVIWTFAGANPHELFSAHLGTGALLRLTNLPHEIDVASDGSAIIDAFGRGVVVVAPNGNEHVVYDTKSRWECEREQGCKDRFVRVLPRGDRYLAITGDHARELEPHGDVREPLEPQQARLEVRNAKSDVAVTSVKLSPRVHELTVAPDGKTAVVMLERTGSTLATAIVYDVPALTVRAQVGKLEVRRESEIAISRDGARYMFAVADGLDVIETATGAHMHFACAIGYGVTLAFLGNGDLVSAGSRGGASECLGAFNVANGAILRVSAGDVRVLDASLDHETLVVAEKEWAIYRR